MGDRTVPGVQASSPRVIPQSDVVMYDSLPVMRKPRHALFQYSVITKSVHHRYTLLVRPTSSYVLYIMCDADGRARRPEPHLSRARFCSNASSTARAAAAGFHRASLFVSRREGV